MQKENKNGEKKAGQAPLHLKRSFSGSRGQREEAGEREREIFFGGRASSYVTMTQLPKSQVQRSRSLLLLLRLPHRFLLFAILLYSRCIVEFFSGGPAATHTHTDADGRCRASCSFSHFRSLLVSRPLAPEIRGSVSVCHYQNLQRSQSASASLSRNRLLYL